MQQLHPLKWSALSALCADNFPIYRSVEEIDDRVTRDGPEVRPTVALLPAKFRLWPRSVKYRPVTIRFNDFPPSPDVYGPASRCRYQLSLPFPFFISSHTHNICHTCTGTHTHELQFSWPIPLFSFLSVLCDKTRPSSTDAWRWPAAAIIFTSQAKQIRPRIYKWQYRPATATSHDYLVCNTQYI